MSTSKTRFISKIKPYLKRLPNSVWFYGSKSNNIPQIAGCVNGTFIAIEIGPKLRRAQVDKLDNIRSIGGVGIVLQESNWSDIYDGLVMLAQDHRPEEYT